MEQVNHYGFSIKVEAVLTQLLQRYTKIEFVTLFIGGRKNSAIHELMRKKTMGKTIKIKINEKQNL